MWPLWSQKDPTQCTEKTQSADSRSDHHIPRRSRFQSWRFIATRTLFFVYILDIHTPWMRHDCESWLVARLSVGQHLLCIYIHLSVSTTGSTQYYYGTLDATVWTACARRRYRARGVCGTAHREVFKTATWCCWGCYHTPVGSRFCW